MSETTTEDEVRLLTDDATSGVLTKEAGAEEKKIFPLPYLLFFAGYCLVLFIDRVFAGHFGHLHGHSHGHGDIKDYHGSHAHHDHHGFHNNCSPP